MPNEVQIPQISLARRYRGLLAALCLIAILAGLLLRKDQPFSMLIAGYRAIEIAKEAEQIHAEILSDEKILGIPDAQCAARLEAETVPLWREAVSLMEQAQAVGAEGPTFEGLTRCYRLRLEASTLMATGIREQDSEQLAVARQQWQESEEIAAKIKATPIAFPFKVGG